MKLGKAQSFSLWSLIRKCLNTWIFYELLEMEEVRKSNGYTFCQWKLVEVHSATECRIVRSKFEKNFYKEFYIVEMLKKVKTVRRKVLYPKFLFSLRHNVAWPSPIYNFIVDTQGKLCRCECVCSKGNLRKPNGICI